MNKLFWIVCEDGDTTLYEGRFQGRTRTAAIKFLKATLRVKSLKGLVYTVTEIPVPLLREIIAELLGISPEMVGQVGISVVPKSPSDSQEAPSTSPTSVGSTITPADPKIQSQENVPVEPREFVPAARSRNQPKVGNPGLGDDFWAEVHAYWRECRSVKQTAIKFSLSQNSVKTRARREGWRKGNPKD